MKTVFSFDLQRFATTQNTTSSLNTGTGSVATKPAAYYDKLMLELLVQTDFMHDKFAQQRPMPTKTGDTVNFRKIVPLVASDAPLTEGVTPDGLNGQVTAISVTTVAHGDWMPFTDMVDVTMVDPIIKEYTVELARAFREKLDGIVRDELNAGSQVAYAGGKTDRATLAAGDKPTINDFRKAVLTMKKNHVKPASNGLFASFITPDVAYDLMDDPKFEKAYEIGQNNKPFVKGELANVYGIKFIELTNAKVFEGAGAAGEDVHSSVILGRQPYGITKIKGHGVETIVKALGSAGSEDPLNQRQSIGVKLKAFAVKRLQEEGIFRYESVPSNA
jgi:N4-gp56 family major capsid protein